MSLFSRFLGKSDTSDSDQSLLVPNTKIEHPLGLQVLFRGPCDLTSQKLKAAFRSTFPELRGLRCEVDPEIAREGPVVGMVGWGKHVIRCLGFQTPMPEGPLEVCVRPAHYSQELKERARAHQAHVLLYYSGYDDSALEQYIALAVTAGALGRLGAIVVLNEAAHTSLPTSMLSDSESLEALSRLPLTMLYCGFVKLEVAGTPGVWMRTFGAPLLGLPDLAALAAGHHEGERYFKFFNAIFSYLRAGSRLAAGHTMQIGDGSFRLRSADDSEYFLKSDRELLVIEARHTGG